MLKYRLLDLFNAAFIYIKLFFQHMKLKKKVNIEKIFYGENKTQYIYFIKPKNITKKQLIIFVNGSAWALSNAFMYKFIGSLFGLFGYATVICNHRIIPKHTYPTQINDIIDAIKKSLELVKDIEVIKKILLMGYSSGAQLTCLLTYSNYLEQKGLSKDIISGSISISGPINFYVCKNKALVNDIKKYVVTLSNRENADPFTHLVSGNLMPILCIHGKDDPLVEIDNSITFIDKVNELDKGKGELILIENGYHFNMIKLFHKDYIDNRMIKWIENIENSIYW